MDSPATSRTVVITGANSGIGKAAAEQFAAEGWRVIIACRNIEKGQRALEEIVDVSGSRSIQVMTLDVSSFESIRSFSSAFRGEYDKLDILIHNAAYFEHGIRTYQLSADGVELTFATNVFGPLLLTEMLLSSLSQSNDPRVLFASSTSVKTFFNPKRRIEFDNLRGEHGEDRSYSVYKMYGDSKMAVLLLTYRMSTEYAPHGIKVNAIMIPATRVSKETLGRMRGRYRLIGPVVQNLNPWALEPAQVAASYYHICSSDEFQHVTGTLIDTRHEIIAPAESSGRRLDPISLVKELWNTRHTPAYANDPDNIEQMWDLAQQVIGQAAGHPARQTSL